MQQLRKKPKRACAQRVQWHKGTLLEARAWRRLNNEPRTVTQHLLAEWHTIDGPASQPMISHGNQY